ncbi:MAG TPA: ScbR family autoregulator-binding transcription factor [Pseudonocardiaceae bacterium]|nr:ScbR family autoregulator-binding transcription factor [Pseudonocardiaceae bacterium]
MSSTAPRKPGAAGSDASADRGTLQPRARATRLAILTAAAEHFARNGYHATSLDRVLADSGGTKGALYFHFASKEALARAVITELVQRWENLRVHVSDRGLDPLSALLALVDDMIAELIDSPIVRGGIRLLNDLPMHPDDARGHCAFGERDTLALLTEAARVGLLREGIEPEPVARQIVALLAGHRQICEYLGNRQELWQRVDEAWGLLLPAISTDAWLAEWCTSPWESRTRPARREDEPDDRPTY